MTIKTLAHLADVSKSTVSRAFNDGDAGINDRTRKRILNLAKEMNYQPNMMARSLRSKRTHTLGLIITQIANPYFAELTEAVGEKTVQSGFHLLLGIIGKRFQEEAQYIKLFQSDRVDGMLIVRGKGDTSLSQFDYFLELKRKNFPFVIMGDMGQLDVDYVTYDDERAAFMLTSHLLDSGHRRIGFICEDPSDVQDRINGYRKAFYKRNIAPADDLLVHIDNVGIKPARQAAGKLLSMQDRPTAIIGVNDFVAFGILQAVRECGLSVPLDVAVAGFDNIELVNSLEIPLTTVAFPVENLAENAVNLLLENIDGAEKKEPMHIVLEPKLIIRQSTKTGNRQ